MNENKENSSEQSSLKEDFRKTLKTENPDVKAVEVSYVKKESFDYLLIIKWIFGLYIAGVIAMLLELGLRFISNVLYSYLATTSLMTAEVSMFVDVLRTPIIILMLILPITLPGLLAFLLIRKVLNKANVFPEKQKVFYLYLIAVLITFITLTAYF